MKEKYENLDGFRALAAIGIILMHVRANGDFKISGFIYDRVIASFTDLTFFFMLLSAFSMCCGYYEKFKIGSINIEEFYKRRYKRIWPFFVMLCTFELIIDRSLHSLYEWFADITLAFGLLPNARISVVGVGWFIGIIFVFYIAFPFFTFLIGNKKRAWIVLIATIILNFLCNIYFLDETHVIRGFSGRVNIIYSAMFFIAGGLVFLYREKIKKLEHAWVMTLITVLCMVFYYAVNNSEYTMLILFSLLAMLGIMMSGNVSKILLQNKALSFIASISMEIYLSHMFVFRVLEKLKLTHITENEVLNYVIVSFTTVIGAIVMAFTLKRIIEVIMIQSTEHRWRKSDESING